MLKFINRNAEWLLPLVALLFLILLAPFIMIIRSHMEAKAYNRLTGSDVTTWEAMWVELRVDGAPRDAGK